MISLHPLTLDGSSFTTLNIQTFCFVYNFDHVVSMQVVWNLCFFFLFISLMYRSSSRHIFKKNLKGKLVEVCHIKTKIRKERNSIEVLIAIKCEAPRIHTTKTKKKKKKNLCVFTRKIAPHNHPQQKVHILLGHLILRMLQFVHQSIQLSLKVLHVLPY